MAIKSGTGLKEKGKKTERDAVSFANYLVPNFTTPRRQSYYQIQVDGIQLSLGELGRTCPWQWLKMLSQSVASEAEIRDISFTKSPFL